MINHSVLIGHLFLSSQSPQPVEATLPESGCAGGFSPCQLALFPLHCHLVHAQDGGLYQSEDSMQSGGFLIQGNTQLSSLKQTRKCSMLSDESWSSLRGDHLVKIYNFTEEINTFTTSYKKDR